MAQPQFDVTQLSREEGRREVAGAQSDLQREIGEALPFFFVIPAAATTMSWSMF
jgi:hypothetical protein